MATDIALVGIGDIARSHHIPAIDQSADWSLAATVSRSTQLDGAENFKTIDQLLRARPDISVVSLCMPPAPRFDIARAAIEANRHVMLEKPPGATVVECRILQQLAQATNVALFATWHSREASKLDKCQTWLADKEIRSFEVIWKEDVRRWHAGQEWIWEPGGLGVFDAGINALSILTKILPEPVRVTAAELESPVNKQTPIAASLQLSSNGSKGSAVFDWRQQGEQVWQISINTNAGRLELSEGGACMSIDGELYEPDEGVLTLANEYPRLYDRMSHLIVDSTIDCDFTPLELVADAFMLAQHTQVEAFEF